MDHYHYKIKNRCLALNIAADCRVYVHCFDIKDNKDQSPEGPVVTLIG